MFWLPLSLVAAFSMATADALSKRFHSSLSPYEMAVSRLIYTLPWLVGSFLVIPIVKPDTKYFIAIALGVPLEGCALYCYMRAIKVSPLSLTLPFLAFTPAFTILAGRIFLGERVSVIGLTGIFLIVIGSYCLNLSHIKGGLFAPIKAIFKEPGSRLMLLVSCIYSITAVISKVGILHSNPYFFGVTYFTALSILMLVFIPLMPGFTVRRLTGAPFKGMIVGATYAIMIFSHMLALSQVQAAYMISIKRTSLLFGLLYGAWWFREKGIGERLLGMVIMIAGIFIIGFFS
jgi:drug/metabolite transporter (DMT)-like permease